MEDYNPDNPNNPHASYFHKMNMRMIANVADVLFEPSLTSPKYTGTFADGQRITFDPNTVDWDQLERTCKFWSRRHIIDAFGRFVEDFDNDRLVKKIILNLIYGVVAAQED